MKEIEEFLINNSDKKYAEFQRRIINNIPEVKIYGSEDPIASEVCERFLEK